MRKAGLIVLASTLAVVGLLLAGWHAGAAAGLPGRLIHPMLAVAILFALVGTVVGVGLLVMASRR